MAECLALFAKALVFKWRHARYCSELTLVLADIVLAGLQTSLAEPEWFHQPLPPLALATNSPIAGPNRLQTSFVFVQQSNIPVQLTTGTNAFNLFNGSQTNSLNLSTRPRPDPDYCPSPSCLSPLCTQTVKTGTIRLVQHSRTTERTCDNTLDPVPIHRYPNSTLPRQHYPLQPVPR